MIALPHQGIDKVRFGMDRGAVEAAFGATPRRFVRNKYALEEDVFEGGVSVLYDETGACSAVSLTRGLGTDWEYNGYRLLAHPAAEVRDWAAALDPAIDLADGFTSKALGLGMWADWLNEPDLDPAERAEPAMSFIVFRQNYHEDEALRIARLRGA